MAITNTTVQLPAAIANEVISNAIGASAVMQLARRVQLNGHGVAVPVITGNPTANFVDEGSVKPHSDAEVTPKLLKPRTVAIIVPMSNQFRRDNEMIYSEIVRQLPALLGERFDQEVFHGTPVTGFDTLKGAAGVSINSNAWAGLVAARAAVEAADGELTGWALSNQAVTKMLASTDTTGRTLFTQGVSEAEYGRLIGEPVVKARKAYAAADTADEVLGFAGDWEHALWGIVDGINISIADQASLTTEDGCLNLWESNMFAVRCEMDVAFGTAYANQFVKLTGNPNEVPN